MGTPLIITLPDPKIPFDICVGDTVQVKSEETGELFFAVVHDDPRDGAFLARVTSDLDTPWPTWSPRAGCPRLFRCSMAPDTVKVRIYAQFRGTPVPEAPPSG